VEIGQLFQVRAAMQDITLEVILHAVFGLREGERYRQLKPLLAAMLNMTDSPLRSSMLFLKFLQQDLGNWSPWGQMMRRKQQIYDLLQAEINERRTQPELSGNDVLSLMMSARDENGQPMTDVELHHELMTLLFAGHEHCNGFSWAFYWIHQLPSVHEKLLSELDSLGDKPEQWRSHGYPILMLFARKPCGFTQSFSLPSRE
jgi:unspecific monooxygenase